MKREVRGPGRPRDAELAARREEEILLAAGRFFARTGYRQADIQVLADELGIGKGTIYRYFPTKEALFFAAVDAGMRELTECIDRALAGEEDVIRHMRLGVEAYLEYFDRHPELVELLIIERAEFRDRKQATYFLYKERYHEKRVAFTEAAIRAGLVRNLPVDRIVGVIGDALYGVVFTNHFAGRKVPFKEQAGDIIEIFFNGILTDTGRNALK